MTDVLHEWYLPKAKPIFCEGDLVIKDTESDLFNYTQGKFGIIVDSYSSDSYHVYWVDTQVYQTISRYFLERYADL